MDRGSATNGVDAPYSSKDAMSGKSAADQPLANGTGYLQAPGQEEDDGRGLLGGERSNAGSIEVHAARPPNSKHERMHGRLIRASSGKGSEQRLADQG